MSEIEKAELKAYAGGHKDARTATIVWMREHKNEVLTEHLIKKYQDEV